MLRVTLPRCSPPLTHAFGVIARICLVLAVAVALPLHGFIYYYNRNAPLGPIGGPQDPPLSTFESSWLPGALLLYYIVSYVHNVLYVVCHPSLPDVYWIRTIEASRLQKVFFLAIQLLNWLIAGPLLLGVFCHRLVGTISASFRSESAAVAS